MGRDGAAGKVWGGRGEVIALAANRAIRAVSLPGNRVSAGWSSAGVPPAWAGCRPDAGAPPASRRDVQDVAADVSRLWGREARILQPTYVGCYDMMSAATPGCRLLRVAVGWPRAVRVGGAHASCRCRARLMSVSRTPQVGCALARNVGAPQRARAGERRRIPVPGAHGVRAPPSERSRHRAGRRPAPLATCSLILATSRGTASPRRASTQSLCRSACRMLSEWSPMTSMLLRMSM